MEQEVHPSQLLSPNGENGVYSSCSDAFDEILSHLPEAANPAPRAELDVLSDEEEEAPAAKKEKPSAVKVEKIGKDEEEDEEDVTPELPMFIQDWKSAEKFEAKKTSSWKSDSEMSEVKWKIINGDASAADDVNFSATFHEASTASTATVATRIVADVVTSENLLPTDVHVFDRSKEVRHAAETEIDLESGALQTEFSDQLHQSPGKLGLESNEEMDAALQKQQQHQQQQQLGDQQDTVFTVQFQVSASIVELPDDENSSDDDVTSKNGSEDTVLRDDHRSTSGEAKSSPDDVISTIDDERGNLVTEDDLEDGDLEKTYVYEIFQPVQTSDDQTGSPSRSTEAHLTRVMMRIRDQEIDGCIERRTLNEETPAKHAEEFKEDEKMSTSLLQSRVDEAKQEDQKTPEVEERNELLESKKKFHADETAVPQRSPAKEVPAERPPSVDKVKGRFGEEHAMKTKRAAVSMDLTTKFSTTSSEHVVETTKKSRTPSSGVSSPLVIKGESTKCIREEELPAPNSTKALLAKFKSLERDSSLQRLDKDKHPRPTRSSNMTLSTSSLSGSFDRHSHSSGKQLAGRHQATVGAESTYPLPTRSPSESVCSSDWDTESFGSDILQQQLLQSTQHLTSKEVEEESVLLTKSLLAQWKLLEEHERRLKQLEKIEKGLTASDAKIRSRSLGRLQSSIEKRISLLETPEGHNPFASDVLDASASLSKSLTLPKTSKPSLMRNESPASLKDQMFHPSCTRSDSSESLQQAKAKDFQQYLPPPFMTRYVLAKFKEMEALPQIGQTPSTESTRKTFKWEVKEANPIGTYRGTTVEFRYRKPGSYEPFYRRSYSEEPRRIHFEMKAQDAISEEGQPPSDTPGKEKSTKSKECPDGGQSDRKSDVDCETALKVDSNLESKKDLGSKRAENLAEAKQYILKSYLDKHEPKEQSKKVVKSLLNYFNSLDEDKEKMSEKVLSGKK